jgi:glycosyltransferase involved in cell wall biosynthesis
MISLKHITKTNQPLVSVIVPCFNHEKFVLQCIKSILDQTYKYIELIVIDDGSKDQSICILKEINKIFNFKLIIQENRGLAATLNRGIKEFSSGQYLSFCASDDYWELDKIQKQVDFMENNKFYPMCYGRTYYVNEESEIINRAKDETLKGGSIFEDIFLFKLHPPVNYMYRRDIFDELGFHQENVFAEDYDMNLKISSKYCIGFIDDYLGFYRLTDFTNKINRVEKVAESHLISIEKYQHLPQYFDAKRMVHLRKFDNYSGYKRFKIKACQSLFKSIKFFYKTRFILGVIKLYIYWK